MDAREELKRWIALVVELSADEESKVIKQDIDVLLSAAGALTGALANRNTALARKIRPRSVAPPKPSPVAGPQQQDGGDKQSGSTKDQNDAQGRSQERSGQSQQKQRSEPSPTDQQRALRGYVYGAQNDEVAFRKAAQAITR